MTKRSRIDKHQRGRNRGESGFTLIEMAIVVLISGFLLAAYIQAYQTYIVSKEQEETLENMKMIDDALFSYFGDTGRYPCPSNPDAAPGEADYGVQQCRLTPASACPGTIVCDDGERDADGDGTTDTILIGAVPIAELLTIDNIRDELQLLPKHVLDGWGNKLTYAVSENMASEALNQGNPARNDWGSIDLVDENSRSVVTPQASTHWVLLSHGRNAKGAFTWEGENQGDCLVGATATVPAEGNNLATAGVETELENCDRNDGVFVKALLSFSEDDNYFDDLVYFQASTSQSLWVKSQANTSDPDPDINTQDWFYNTNLGNVGVGQAGTPAETPTEMLTVAGSIKAEEEFRSDNFYCDGTGDYCVNPEFFGGAGDSCGTNEAMTAVYGDETGNHDINCDTVFTAPVTSASCPPGEFLYAFSNLGNVACEPL